VPAAYRSHLSNLGYNSVICYPSFTNSSIEFCPQSRLEKIAETIDTLNPFEENRDIFSTSILANSSQLNFDGEGRITLSEKLLEHSGIKEKILFVGQGKTFQMWEPAEFKKFSDQARKKANLKRSELKWKQSNN
jgi:MraZ protein